MSLLTMTQPTPHAPFKREFSWDEGRLSNYAASKPRSDTDRVALPSIRQTFPEFQLGVTRSEVPARTPSSTSPVARPGTITPPDYTHSPNSNKRRRLSIEEERELERASRVPRLYGSPRREPEHPTRSRRGMSPAMISQAGSCRESPYLSHVGSLPSLASPGPMEPLDREEPPYRLPSVPMLGLDRGSAPPVSGIRSHPNERYPPPESIRSMPMHPASSSYPPPHPSSVPASYRPGGYPYGTYNHHPTRGQSLSVGSVHSFDQPPFSPTSSYSPHPHLHSHTHSHLPHGHPHVHVSYHGQEYVRVSDLNTMPAIDSKQRKRRGNLPKETTEKLRSWFLAHLHHPYPTEDEKQELMRQTGLQMNQISNWFINARRRQLPTMINNARAESDALLARGVVDNVGKILPSTEPPEYEEDSKLSDGEASSAFEDELDRLKRRQHSRGSV